MVSAFYDEAWAHRDVDAWPFLLAGPIVRRVARGSAAVFVATREACSVTLTLHEGTSASSRAVGSATAPTVPLGLRLHVCVVEATGLTLTPGQLYGYDLSFAATSGTFTLADLGELQGSVPLGYLQGDLPAFLLPGSADDLRIVHSSCRKMHGGVEGQGIEPDMLHVLDRLIQDAGTDPRARPQQLFLTGDQIYADDVPAAVLDATTRLGRLLLGWSIPETFPDRDGVTTYPDDHVGLDPGDRSVFLDAQGVKDRPPGVEGLCDYAASHLLFFGEWCAMYLLAWSPALWQMRVLVDPDDAEAHPSRSWFVLNETKDVLSDVDKPPDTTTAALVYAQTLPFVRRALANVATYMIFDDHDVTDDWFLNGKVDAQLRGRGEDPGPGGRRLMRNALAAYAVFQHWGNAPEQFAPGTPGSTLLTLFRLPTATGGTPQIGQPGLSAAADIVLDVGAQPLGIARAAERMRWDYELVFDSHRVIVLDSRTWRTFPGAPPPLDPDALLQAAADRVEITAEWGTDTLAALGSLWSRAAADLLDAAGAGAGARLQAFAEVLDAGGLLMDTLALAGEGVTATGGSDLSHDVAGAAATLLRALLLTPVVIGADWATLALTEAIEAIEDTPAAPSQEAVSWALAMSTSLGAGVHVLAAGLDRWVADTGLAAMLEAELALWRTLRATGDLLDAAAAFLQGAAVSLGRASRATQDLITAWTAIAVDGATTLAGSLGTAAAGALSRAAGSAASLEAAYQAARAEYASSVDPVWELVAGNRASRVNAELIGEDALQLQVVDRVAQPANARDLTFVVASAPVIGHALVEFIQRAKLLETALAGSPNAPEEWDSEPWSGNEIAWARLLDALTDLGSVVFLSGDVHYAYSVAADHRRRADGAGARFVQLTSSPTKNLVAMSVTLAQFEEALAEANQLVWLQFDLAEVLPTAQDLRELPADVWQLSQEKWTEAVTDHLARIGAIRADMSTDDWFWEGWTKEALVEALRREQQEEWYELQSAWRPIQELVGQSLLETRDDAAYAFVGDRLLDAPVLQEETLLLLHSLGVDPERLVDLRTTVLRDPRLKDRAADSPELEGRLGLLQARTATLLRERTTVAQHNIGVVRTEDTTLGRFVVHDLHWMPYPDLEQQIDLLSEGAQARGDWIITRHVAGLTRTTPADGAIFGVPL